MYSNAKKTNVENIVYSFVNGGKDLYITFNPPQIKKNTNFIKFTNNELYGKEYEILISDLCVHYGIIEKNINIFPVNDIPLYQITYYPIHIIIKNVIVNTSFELNIDHEFTNNSCDNDYEMNWPLNKKFVKNNYFEENNITCNKLIIRNGLAGLLYMEYSDKNNYSDIVIKNGKRITIDKINYLQMNYDSYNNHDVTAYPTITNLEIFQIDEPNEDIYYTNKILDPSIDADIIMHNTKIEMTKVDDCKYEYILVGDAFAKMKLYCNGQINKIVYQNKSVEYTLPFHLEETTYVLSFDNEYNIPYISPGTKIIVYSDMPVKMDYYTCVYMNEKLRKEMAIVTSSNFCVMNYSHSLSFFR